jgi:hypothetical protein
MPYTQMSGEHVTATERHVAQVTEEVVSVFTLAAVTQHVLRGAVHLATASASTRRSFAPKPPASQPCAWVETCHNGQLHSHSKHSVQATVASTQHSQAITANIENITLSA